MRGFTGEGGGGDVGNPVGWSVESGVEKLKWKEGGGSEGMRSLVAIETVSGRGARRTLGVLFRGNPHVTPKVGYCRVANTLFNRPFLSSRRQPQLYSDYGFRKASRRTVAAWDGSSRWRGGQCEGKRVGTRLHNPASCSCIRSFSADGARRGMLRSSIYA